MRDMCHNGLPLVKRFCCWEQRKPNFDTVENVLVQKPAYEQIKKIFNHPVVNFDECTIQRKMKNEKAVRETCSTQI